MILIFDPGHIQVNTNCSQGTEINFSIHKAREIVQDSTFVWFVKDNGKDMNTEMGRVWVTHIGIHFPGVDSETGN